MTSRQIAIAVVPKFSAFFSICGSACIMFDILCSHFDIDIVEKLKEIKNRGKEDEGGIGGSSNNRRTSFSLSRDNSTGSSSAFGSNGGNNDPNNRRASFAQSSRRLSTSQSARKHQSSRRGLQRKTLKNSAYYRLMLTMSTTDFIVSFAWFMTTWPIPSDENSPDTPSDKVWGNRGTMQTCTAQAFFIQLGIITPFYNALLSLYYYLTIRKEWKEEDFKKKVEYAGHFVSLGFGFGTSIAGLIMKLFNNSIVWCWIAPYPFPEGCGTEGNPPCERGTDAKSYRWIFYYGPLWVMIVLVATFMSLVYSYVRSLDVKMDKYTRKYETPDTRRGSFTEGEGGGSDGSGQMRQQRRGSESRASRMMRSLSVRQTLGSTTTDPQVIAQQMEHRKRQRRNERSKAVANQGMFYAGTFALVWLFGTITRAMQLAGATPPWAIIFLFAMLTPSQGFFNFLVYIRPRLIKYFAAKKKQREKRGSTASSPVGGTNSNVYHVSGFSQTENETGGRSPESSSEFEVSKPPVVTPRTSTRPLKGKKSRSLGFIPQEDSDDEDSSTDSKPEKDDTKNKDADSKAGKTPKRNSNVRFSIPEEEDDDGSNENENENTNDEESSSNDNKNEQQQQQSSKSSQEPENNDIVSMEQMPDPDDESEGEGDNGNDAKISATENSSRVDHTGSIRSGDDHGNKDTTVSNDTDTDDDDVVDGAESRSAVPAAEQHSSSTSAGHHDEDKDGDEEVLATTATAVVTKETTELAQPLAETAAGTTVVATPAMTETTESVASLPAATAPADAPVDDQPLPAATTPADAPADDQPLPAATTPADAPEDDQPLPAATTPADAPVDQAGGSDDDDEEEISRQQERTASFLDKMKRIRSEVKEETTSEAVAVATTAAAADNVDPETESPISIKQAESLEKVDHHVDKGETVLGTNGEKQQQKQVNDVADAEEDIAAATTTTTTIEVTLNASQEKEITNSTTSMTDKTIAAKRGSDVSTEANTIEDGSDEGETTAELSSPQQ